jgi:cyclopropane fatty-acyl-phospholipid synthase-like methyltransferase
MAWKSTAEAPKRIWRWTNAQAKAAVPEEEAEAVHQIHEHIKISDGKGLEDKSILDLGCGRAACLREADALGAGELIGVDSSIHAIKAAVLALPRIKHVLSDAMDTPLPSKRVDIVWSHGVVEHFREAELFAYFREAARISRDWIAFSAPNPNCGPYAECREYLLQTEKWEWGYEEPLGSYAKYIEQQGFGVVVERTIGTEWKHVLSYAKRTDGRLEHWKKIYKDGHGDGVYTLIIGRRRG